MRRVRRNADERARRLERAAASGDQHAVAALVAHRIRSGAVSLDRARFAWLFSEPMEPITSTGGLYDWFPVEEGTVQLTAQDVAQDPRTLFLHEVLVGILGGEVERPDCWSGVSSEAWDEFLLPNGVLVSETGGDLDHPPFEIQYDQNVERETEEEQQAVDDTMFKIGQAYAEAGLYEGDRFPHQGDSAFMWFVREQAFAGNSHALETLAFLRYCSSVEYANVLGVDVYRGGLSSRETIPFGLQELALVTSLLGGSPLWSPRSQARSNPDERLQRARRRAAGGDSPVRLLVELNRVGFHDQVVALASMGDDDAVQVVGEPDVECLPEMFACNYEVVEAAGTIFCVIAGTAMIETLVPHLREGTWWVDGMRVPSEKGVADELLDATRLWLSGQRSAWADGWGPSGYFAGQIRDAFSRSLSIGAHRPISVEAMHAIGYLRGLIEHADSSRSGQAGRFLWRIQSSTLQALHMALAYGVNYREVLRQACVSAVKPWVLAGCPSTWNLPPVRNA